MNEAANKIRIYIQQQGWTLVELLVAMVLALLLIAGIGQIYLAAKRSYDIQNSLARLQEVGRYATELLTKDIQRAGYWGMMDPNSATLTNDVTPAPDCGSDDSWGRMVKEKIFGLNDVSGSYSCISRLRGDVLTIRYGNPSTVTPYKCPIDPSFYPGVDCTKFVSKYIRVTPLTGIIATGPASTVGSPPTLDLELVTYAYYVADSTQARECGKNSAPAPFLPALVREGLIKSGVNVGKPQKEELITGVEQLQFQYGVDTDNDKSVNQYMNADELSAADWQAVRTVRFWVLVRDDCPDNSYTDHNKYNMGNFGPWDPPNVHFRRALYTSTVTLRN